MTRNCYLGKRDMSFEYPYVTSMQNPIEGMYKILSATTKPTGKKRLDAGRNGRIIHENDYKERITIKTQTIMPFNKHFNQVPLPLKRGPTTTHTHHDNHCVPIDESHPHNSQQHYIEQHSGQIARIGERLHQCHRAHRPVAAER